MNDSRYVEEIAMVQYPKASGSKGISSTMLDGRPVASNDTAIRDICAGLALATVVPIPRQSASSSPLEETNAMCKVVCLQRLLLLNTRNWVTAASSTCDELSALRACIFI